MHACLYLLLRSPHPPLPRPERPRGLRARDRRQGERAGAAASRAAAAVVEGRGDRARDQHRPLSVGRGPLRAHARDLGGADRGAQPGLGVDEVAPPAARHRPLPGAERGRRLPGEPLDPDARRGGMARERAAHAAPAQAHRGGGGAARGRGARLGPGRAADAGDQRLAGAGRGDPPPVRRGGRVQRRRARPAPEGRGTGDLPRLAPRLPPRPAPALRGPLRAAAHSCRSASATGSRSG